jgi:hypothetical protein
MNMNTQDKLVGTVVKDKLGRWTITAADRTCYQPNHTANNPWVEMVRQSDGAKRYGTLKAIAPHLIQ